MNSVLLSIKTLLGIPDNYDHFDNQIIMHINDVLVKLHDIGVISGDPVRISSDTDVWTQVIGDRSDLSDVITYVYLNVRVAFDPPQNGSLMESINRQIAEKEWRIHTRVEKGEL